MLLKAENLLNFRDPRLERGARNMRTMLLFPPDTHAAEVVDWLTANP